MYILVTNDDGYDASGIQHLIEAVSDLAEFVVVAPKTNHSGASSSLTFEKDIHIEKQGDNRYIVSGTPVDCVHLALSLSNFLPKRPDLVVSGINDGANMGDDTIYSGTVAASIEGHLFNVPAMAFSMVTKPTQHFDTGAAVARRLIKHYQNHPFGDDMLLNINIPDIPVAQLVSLKHTRLGRRHVAKPAIIRECHANSWVVRIGEAGHAKDDGVGTDFHAIENNNVSVTPLMVDLTEKKVLSELEKWLAQ